MLYFLLTIIAIGVLLASPEGKELLGSLWQWAVIIGGIYLVFWIVIITIGLLSDQSIREGVFTVLGVIILVAYFNYGVFVVYKKYQRGELTVAKIANSFKNVAKVFLNLFRFKNWKENWKMNLVIIYIILSFSFVAGAWIYISFWQQ